MSCVLDWICCVPSFRRGDMINADAALESISERVANMQETLWCVSALSVYVFS